jgi:MYXO-CTERM domain-containing protein
VPGTVEAENFDPAGYSDTTAANEGGAYRTDVGVDIKALGAGYAVGWMTSGEWLEYTLNVGLAGDYQVTFSIGAVEAGRTIDVAVCGTQVATVDVPQISAWGETTAATAAMHLDAGLQVIRITVGANDYLDLDSMSFALVGQNTGGTGGGGAGVGGTDTGGAPAGGTGTGGAAVGGTATGGAAVGGTGPVSGGSGGLTSSGGVGGAAMGGSVPASGGVAVQEPSDGAENEASGCACQTAGASRSGLWSLGPPFVGLLGLVTRRRRRPRRAGPLFTSAAPR